jgi:hypothetical protein
MRGPRKGKTERAHQSRSLRASWMERGPLVEHSADSTIADRTAWVLQ